MRKISKNQKYYRLSIYNRKTSQEYEYHLHTVISRLMCFLIDNYTHFYCILSLQEINNNNILILLLFIPCSLYKYGLKHTTVLCVQDVEIL